jgi:chitinase
MIRLLALLVAILAAAAAVQGSQAAFSATSTSAGSSFTTKPNFPPHVTLTTPVAGTTTGATPTLSGAAGSNTGDSTRVAVKIYSGSTTAGTVVQTRNVTRSGGTWTWTLTTALASGTYTAQATQADSSSQTGTSAAVTFAVDATRPTAVSVAATNKAGGTAGKIEAGDTITFTYSEVITAASVWSTWDGSSTNVKLRFSGSGNDTFTVLDMNSAANINLGSVATNADYVNVNPTTFTSTIVRSADGTSIIVTLGTPANVQNAANVGRNMSWTVGAGITDLYGNTIATPATYNETDSAVDF